MPVAVVTGGSAGVGRAAARAFADRGYDVAVLARGEERLEATRRELESRGVRALALPADVADPEAVERAAARTEAELGPIDVWVNNAMATVYAFAWQVDAHEYARATSVTYLGAVHGTLAALRRMRPRDRGTIVQVGSALAYRGIPLQAPYCAAKHALKGFTESLRTELLHERSSVHVTMVHLPALNTPQFEWGRTKLPRHPQPVPPIYQPEVAAAAIVYAAEHRRRELLVGGPDRPDRVGGAARTVGPRPLPRAQGRRRAADDGTRGTRPPRQPRRAGTGRLGKRAARSATARPTEARPSGRASTATASPLRQGSRSPRWGS